MIVIAVLGMAQAAVTAPSATDAPLRRDEQTFVGTPFYVPDEIMPAVVPYLNCLHPSTGFRIDGPGGFERVAKSRIKQCESVRAKAISGAMISFKPDSTRAGNAKQQVQAVFDNLDESEVSDARRMDQQFPVTVGAPQSNQQSASKADDALHQ